MCCRCRCVYVEPHTKHRASERAECEITKRINQIFRILLSLDQLHKRRKRGSDEEIVKNEPKFIDVVACNARPPSNINERKFIHFFFVSKGKFSRHFENKLKKFKKFLCLFHSFWALWHLHGLDFPYLIELKSSHAAKRARATEALTTLLRNKV